jgi:RAB protein geranylgeranyltransferase component A
VSVLPSLCGHVITACPNRRICAVSGGTYILGKDFKVEYNEGEQAFRISLDGIDETLSSKAIVAEPSQLPEALLTPPPAPGKLVSRCIAIVDQPIRLVASEPSRTKDNEEPGESAPIPEIDSSILVFPPGNLQGGGAQEAVTALITGEGSMSCPTGFCTYV